MTTYNISMSKAHIGEAEVALFRVGFGEPAQNDQIVRDAEKALLDILREGDVGGRVALINGPASLPVAMVLAHHLLHRFEGLGVFDPKLGGYVAVAQHGSPWGLGVVIPAGCVEEGAPTS